MYNPTGVSQYVIPLSFSICYAGADIADRLIAYGGDLPIQPIHPIQAILQNPEVAALIDDLGLEIKSITYIKPQENESID